MAAAIWSVRAATEGAGGELEVQAGEALADVSQVLFFLTGAMAIVETVDAHQVSETV